MEQKTGAILTVVLLKQTAFTQWPVKKVAEESRAIAPEATKQVRITYRNKELKGLRTLCLCFLLLICVLFDLVTFGLSSTVAMFHSDEW